VTREHSGIDLWFVFFDEINDDAVLCRCRALLTKRERDQEGRFHFPMDRRRYLLTRALVRTTLSRYTSIAPDALLFSTNAYGRPHVANNDDVASRLSFNIAHTRNLIVLAVSFDNAVGVDTENICRPAALAVADQFFSDAEVATIHALPANMRSARFFEYWTLKEAYIKARGVGLSLPLDRFGFRLEGDHYIQFSALPGCDDNPSRWRFWQLRPSDDYLVAICAAGSGSAPTLQMRTIVPLFSEDTVTYSITRCSF
jgi:4'-phosphopantetheinyl transferase